MPSLSWLGNQSVEHGVSHGVVYISEGPLAWNGLVSVQEAQTSSDTQEVYIDGFKRRINKPTNSYQATVTAFTYPSELEHYDSGLKTTKQVRRTLGFSYRTKVQTLFGVHDLIHLVYDVEFQSNDLSYSASETFVPTTFSWTLKTIPRRLNGMYFNSHLIVDTSKLSDDKLSSFEDVIYGKTSTTGRLPSPEEVVDIFEGFTTLRIIDNGDGTWTAIGPEEAIIMLDDTMFQITWESALYVDTDTYIISSS